MTATVQPVQLAVHDADWTYVNELRQRRAGIRRASGRPAVPHETAVAAVQPATAQQPVTARQLATWQDWYPVIAGAVPNGTDPAVIRNIAVTVSMQKYHNLVDELARTLEA
jgi:hypothetical protein